jgi:hypothetical protein
MRFSERYGHVEVRSVVQRDDLDDDARTEIWNLVYLAVIEPHHHQNDVLDGAFVPVWMSIVRYDIDEYPGGGNVTDYVKEWIKDEPWYTVYDIIELLSLKFSEFGSSVNRVLERVKAGYRVIGHRVVPISDGVELDAIEAALDVDHDAVRHHLSQALEHLADRENPDYPNSIKESITAVESKILDMTGKAPLGKGLDVLRKSGPEVHPALVEGWKKIYGWTSDDPGLRHGGATAPDVDQDLARYMLVTCSAFINLLTASDSD